MSDGNDGSDDCGPSTSRSPNGCHLNKSRLEEDEINDELSDSDDDGDSESDDEECDDDVEGDSCEIEDGDSGVDDDDNSSEGGDDNLDNEEGTSDDDDDDDEEEEEEEDEDDEECVKVVRTQRRRCLLPEDGVDLHCSDSSDGQSDKCPICLSRFGVQEIGSPENCDHSFCLDCILEWSKTMRTCPVDRKDFKLVSVREAFNGKILKKIPLTARRGEREQPEAVDENEEPTFCEVCNLSDREDSLLLCDGCDMGFHLECLNPPLQTVPVEEWFCPDCAADNTQNMAERVGIEDGELMDLLEDENVNPRNVGLRSGRSHRLLPRTGQSEAVRRRIARTRALQRRATGTMRDERNLPIPEATNGIARPTRRRRKRRRIVRRPKSKTVKKSKSIDGKTVSSKRKSKKRKPTKKRKTTNTTTKRKKRRVRRIKRKGTKRRVWRKPTASSVATPKSRLADQLGLKILPNRMLPIVDTRLTTKTDRVSHRFTHSAPLLRLFGTTNELHQFDDGEDEANGDVAIARPAPSLISRRRHIKGLSSSALLSHRPLSIGGMRSKVTSQRVVTLNPPASLPSPSPASFDLIGSILNDQRRLNMNSNNVTIKRDGSLFPTREVELTKMTNPTHRSRPTDPSLITAGPRSSSTAHSRPSNPSTSGARSSNETTSNTLQHSSYSNNDNITYRGVGDGLNNDSDYHRRALNSNSGVCQFLPLKKKADKIAVEKAVMVISTPTTTAAAEDDDIDIYSDIESVCDEGQDVSMDRSSIDNDICASDRTSMAVHCASDESDECRKGASTTREVQGTNQYSDDDDDDDLVIDESVKHDDDAEDVDTPYSPVDDVYDVSNNDKDNVVREENSNDDNNERGVEIRQRPDSPRNDSVDENNDSSQIHGDEMQSAAESSRDENEEIDSANLRELLDTEEDNDRGNDNNNDVEGGDSNATDDVESEQPASDAEAYDMDDAVDERNADEDEEREDEMSTPCADEEDQQTNDDDDLDQDQDNEEEEEEQEQEMEEPINTGEENCDQEQEEFENEQDENVEQVSDEDGAEEVYENDGDEEYGECEDCENVEENEKLDEDDVDDYGDDDEEVDGDKAQYEEGVDDEDGVGFHESKCVDETNAVYDSEDYDAAESTLPEVQSDEVDEQFSDKLQEDESERVSPLEEVKQEDDDIEEAEIDVSRLAHRQRRRDLVVQRNTEQRHTMSMTSHRKRGRSSRDYEEGEIVESSTRKVKRSRSSRTVNTCVDEDEYSNYPRVNIPELPRIPKIKRDRYSRQTMSDTRSAGDDGASSSSSKQRTSVMDRLDKGGSAAEISWKKLSHNSKTRNYRDGKPKSEQGLQPLTVLQQQHYRLKESRDNFETISIDDLSKRRGSDMDRDKRKDRTRDVESSDRQRHEREKTKCDQRNKESKSRTIATSSKHSKERHRDKHKLDKHGGSSSGGGGSGSGGNSSNKESRKEFKEKQHHHGRDRTSKEMSTLINKEKSCHERISVHLVDKSKRELKRSRLHRDVKHREHKKRDKGTSVLMTPPPPPLPTIRSREESPVTSKEVYASGDSIIINVNFSRPSGKDAAVTNSSGNVDCGKSSLDRPCSVRDRLGEKRRTSSDVQNVNESKHSKYVDEYSARWNPFGRDGGGVIDEPVEIDLDSEVSLSPMPDDNMADDDDDTDSDVVEIVQPQVVIADVTSLADVDKADQEEGDDDDDDAEIEPPLSITDDLEEYANRTADLDDAVSPRSPPSPEPIAKAKTSSNNGEDNSAYDPFEPTKSLSPSPSPSLSDTSLACLKKSENPEPPPLPELPPLPSEPEPEVDSLKGKLLPPPTTQLKNSPTGISPTPSPSPVKQHPLPLLLNISGVPVVQPRPLLSTHRMPRPPPMTLPNIHVPPPNYIPRGPRLSPGGGERGGMRPPIGWPPVGPPPSNLLFPSGNFLNMPPPLNVKNPQTSLTQIGNLLHSQAAQLALIAGGHHPMSIPPPIAITQLLQQQQQQHHQQQQKQKPLSETYFPANGQSKRDVNEVVDMDVDSPYSPGDHSDPPADDFNDDVGDNDDDQRSVSDTSGGDPMTKSATGDAAESGRFKDRFDSLMGFVHSRKENVQTRGGGLSRDYGQVRTMGRQLIAQRPIAEIQQKKQPSQQQTLHKGLRGSAASGTGGGKDNQKKLDDCKKMDETQLKILDDVPSSAVELQVKEKFLKKLNRQERVIEEVKLAIKPYYNRREITKDDYKEILRKSVPKICHNKSGEINPVKIKALVQGYVKKFKYHRKGSGSHKPVHSKKS